MSINQPQYVTREDLDLIEKGKSKDAWTNQAKTWMKGDNGVPVRPQTIFLGTAGNQPTWDEPVLDYAAFKREKEHYLKSGKQGDIYKVLEDPYIGKWQAVARAYNELTLNALKSGSNSTIKSAGVGQSQDYSAIDIVNVANEMVNTELRPFSLEQAVKTVAVPNLSLEVDAWTRFTGQKNIGEGTAPVLKLGSAARTSFDLPKHGTAVALTFEAQARAVHDIYRANVENAISDLKRIKSNLIAVELETATDVSGADWAAYTTDHSTTSPYDNIGTVSDTITANNGSPNTIASHDKVWRDFIGNTHVHGLAEGPSHDGEVSSARVITNVPGLPGYTWYIDNEKTATIATVYEKDAVYKMQGPVRTAVFRQELEDVDAFRIFDFMLTEIIIAGRIRDITGVTA